jgi:hypothetical protein
VTVGKIPYHLRVRERVRVAYSGPQTLTSALSFAGYATGALENPSPLHPAQHKARIAAEAQQVALSYSRFGLLRVAKYTDRQPALPLHGIDGRDVRPNSYQRSPASR